MINPEMEPQGSGQSLVNSESIITGALVELEILCDNEHLS